MARGGWRWRFARGAVAVLTVTALVAACGDDDDDDAGSDATTATTAASDATTATTAATSETSAASTATTAGSGTATTTAGTAAGDDIAGTPVPKPLPEKTAVTVTMPVKIEGFAYLLLADALDEFEKENLEVEFVTVPGSEALVLLGSGEADITMGSPNAGFYNAIDAGLEVRWIAPNFSPNPDSIAGLWIDNDILGSDGVAQADEVRGMSVALGQLGLAAGSAQVVRDFLEPLGLTLADIEVSNLQGADMVLALGNGGIDSGVVLDPFNQQVKAAGQATLVGTFPNYSTGGFIAERFRTEQPEVIDAFMRAILRTTRTYLQGDYHADPEVLAALAESIGVEPSVLEANPPLVWDPELKIDPQASTALQELWIEAGVIEYDTVKPDSEIVDQSSIERVLAEI
jgi:NitT/TauT family transport system substrate-binding protein